MLNLNKEYSKILKSEEYKKWKSENKDAYLSSVFFDEVGFQFNYLYNKKMRTFFLNKEKVFSQDGDIFGGADIKKLDLREVKFTLTKVDKLMDEAMRDKHERATKKLFVLQQTDFPLWNITYITASLKVANFKINAISGDIIEQKFEYIMELNSEFKKNLS